MRYFSGGLFHQGKFFPVEFRAQSVFSLATFVHLSSRCLYPCRLHVVYITYISISFMLLFLNGFPFTTSLFQLFPYSATIFVWRNTFVSISLLRSSSSNIIVDWIITINATLICSHYHHRKDISGFIQLMKEQKNNLWIRYNWNIFFHSGI